MSGLKRVSITIDGKLLEKFDHKIGEQGYPTRSKAITDLIRESLVEKEWEGSGNIAGAITLVYDHHRRDLLRRLTAVQHEFHQLIVSSQHIHMDHDNCFEIVVVKGKPGEVRTLAKRLKSIKGVKHSALVMATTGKGIA